MTSSSAAAADNKSSARQHLESGFQHADKGDWETALVQFEEAHHLDPQPTTLYDVAQARFKTGRYRAAIDAYRALLAAKSALSANQVATAQKQLGMAENKVARLTVTAKAPSQPNDEVTVDDQPVTRSPVVLDPGAHVARLRRAGAVVGERRVDLAEGANVLIELEPAPAPAPAPAPEKKKPDAIVAPSPPEQKKSSTTSAWIVTGAGGAFLLAGSIFAIRGYGAWSDLDGTCGPTKTCREGDVDVAQRDVLIGDLGIGIGLVAVGVGVIMLVTSPSTSDAKSARSKLPSYPLTW